MVKIITADSQNTSVEDIMEKVNHYVIRTGMAQKDPGYGIQDEYAKLFDRVQVLDQTREIDYEQQITAQGRFIRLKIFGKKALRKLMKWYIKDIVIQQNVYNANMYQCIRQELYIMDQMNQELIRLKKENKKLEDERK